MAGMIYGTVLAQNITAAREGAQLSEEDLAVRMQKLGFSTWLQQTVAEAEQGELTLTADEVLGLSVALEIPVTAVMLPPDDNPAEVALPGGQAVVLQRHDFEPTLWWYGNEPSTIPPPWEKARHG
jgi:hypothetical protein